MSSRVWVPMWGSGGPVKVRDKSLWSEASPGRPQDGRGVGLVQKTSWEEEGVHTETRGGRWAANLGWGGTAPGELAVVVLPWGLGDSRACRREQACGQARGQPRGPCSPGCPPYWPGTGNGGTKRWGTSALLAVDGGGRDRLKGGEMPCGWLGTGAQSGPGPARRGLGWRAGVHARSLGHGPGCPQAA